VCVLNNRNISAVRSNAAANGCYTKTAWVHIVIEPFCGERVAALIRVHFSAADRPAAFIKRKRDYHSGSTRSALYAPRMEEEN
jgi:hypothetical protein